MSKPIDRKAAMRAQMAEETVAVSNRFALAEQALRTQPAGLAAAPRAGAPAGSTFSAESPDAADRSKKNYVKVSVSKVHDNPVNARFIYDPTKVTEMGESIKANGQEVAALAKPHPDKLGEYMLIDGHYRKRGIIAAGVGEIELDVRSEEYSQLDMYKLSYKLNVERSSQTAMDNAMAWRLLQELGLVENEAQIAELVEMSPANVSKTLALLNIPEPVAERMREHPERFGLSTGYEVAMMVKIVDQDQLMAIVNRIVSEGLSSRAVAEIRERLAHPKPRKRSDNARLYKIRNPEGQIGQLKEWDTGKVSFEITLLDPKDRAELMAELRSRFGLNE